MNVILINGISANVGGGKSILVNFLSVLRTSDRKELFVVVVPEKFDHIAYSSKNIVFIPFRNSSISLFKFYFSAVHKIISKYKVSLVFNLADVIIPRVHKQIYLFDWPYAIYPESVVWKRMRSGERLFRRFKLFLVRRHIKLPVLILAQTDVAKERLKRIFLVENVEVVPNAVSVDNLKGGVYRDFKLPADTVKFLYLTKFYAHKNIEVLLEVARIIRQEQLPYCIILTIAGSQHPKAMKFLEDIAKEDLEKIVINVGPVKMENVPSLYQQTDAYLMPTLLESFSGTYVEAMFHSRPIFTSGYDFAKTVCGDAAFYFDPLDAKAIIRSMTSIQNSNEISVKIAAGQERLKDFLTWRQVFDRYCSFFDNNSIAV